MAGMTTKTLLEAINDAMHYEMGQDDRVVVFGEDVGKKGGVFGTTVGPAGEVRRPSAASTPPLSECGIIGTAVGMALYGMRPVAEIQFLDFIYPAFDQIVSEAAKMRYRSRRRVHLPDGHPHALRRRHPRRSLPQPVERGLLLPHAWPQGRDPLDAGRHQGPADLASIRDEDPVMFLEPKRSIALKVKGEVPEGEHVVPLGKGRVVREGSDCTVVAYGAMVPVVREGRRRAWAGERASSIEIIDPRTLVPLDEEIILESVKKTGRCVVVYEAPKTGRLRRRDRRARGRERVIEYLEGPIVRVAGFDTPFPYTLENLYMPDARRVCPRPSTTRSQW